MLTRMHTRAMLTIAAASLSTMTCALAANAAGSRTYVANCANTYYLDFKPSYWSNGCTGGALNVERVRWTQYGRRTARATGRAALRLPCGTNPTCPEAGAYKTAATLLMSRPRRCSTGKAADARFFSRVRLRIRYRAGNPFDEPAGWKTYRFNIRAYEGACEYAP
jgi:hypothetical protein